MTSRIKEVRIIFKDNGKGIEYENMSKLYSPFFTTETQGLGLGLPIVKQIIEKHGGKSNISSIPKKGTTVEIFLPVITERDEVSVPMPEPHISSFLYSCRRNYHSFFQGRTSFSGGRSG